MKNKELKIKKVILKTGVNRVDLIVKKIKRYEVYGLWYRGKVLDLKNDEEISILRMK